MTLKKKASLNESTQHVLLTIGTFLMGLPAGWREYMKLTLNVESNEIILNMEIPGFFDDSLHWRPAVEEMVVVWVDYMPPNYGTTAFEKIEIPGYLNARLEKINEFAEGYISAQANI